MVKRGEKGSPFTLVTSVPTFFPTHTTNPPFGSTALAAFVVAGIASTEVSRERQRGGGPSDTRTERTSDYAAARGGGARARKEYANFRAPLMRMPDDFAREGSIGRDV